MKFIIAIIVPAKFDVIKEALVQMGVMGITVTEVKGFGRQKGHTETYRGSSYIVDFVHKLKLEIVVADESAAKVVDIIVEQGNTGEIGAGKIFVLNAEEVVRIRTNERGAIAV